MNAEEIYGKETKYFNDYQPMLESFGQILVQVDEEGYLGDSWILYEKENRYGFLNFGWGSCSGCDALKACENIKEVQDLMTELEKSIIWFDNKESLLDYFIKTDWKGKYSWQIAEFKTFITHVLNYLDYKEDLCVELLGV